MTNNLKAERTLTAEELQDKAEALERSLEREGEGVNAYLRDDIEAAIAAMRSFQSLSTQQPMGEGTALDIADTCDGVEQYAFEAWAASEKYDMEEHPLHYIFMHPKTDAARMGWRAGIEHARKRLLLSALHPNQESGE